MQSVGFHPHEISRTGRSTDSRIGLVKGWGGGGRAMGSHCLMQNRVSFVGDTNVLKLGGGDSCTTL